MAATKANGDASERRRWLKRVMEGVMNRKTNGKTTREEYGVNAYRIIADGS